MIIGIVNIEGGGKTILAVFYAYMLQRVIKQKKKINLKIISNVRLNSKLINDWEYWNKISELLNTRYSIIIWDEMWISMDARESMRKRNKRLSNITNQIRKKDVVLIYTAQQLGLIDKRVRANTNYIFIPEIDRQSGELIFEILENTRHGHMFMGSKKIYIKPYYRTYNTRQMIEETIFDVEI